MKFKIKFYYINIVLCYSSIKLIQDSYVDDIFSGGKQESINRMVEVKDEEGNYSGNMSKILSSLAFAHLRESILRFQNLIVQGPPIPLSVLGDDGIN